MANVFLSYDRADVSRAQSISDAIEQAGHSVWWDRQIKGGVQYSKEIERALTRADAVVVLWSRHSVDSAWVRDEAAAGRDSGRLVPVAIDGAEPPLGFRQYQTIDLSVWTARRRTTQLQALVEAVGSIAERAGSESGPARSTTRRAPPVGRRELVVGGTVVGLATAAGAGWFWLREDSLTGEARGLVDEARETIDSSNEPDQLSNTVSRLRRAAQLAPDSAEVWGLLALAYGRHSRIAPGEERSALVARAASAAKRSLAIDSNQPEARAATIVIMPEYRNWFAYERAARGALRRHPTHPELQMCLSNVLAEVGRIREALEHLEATMKRRPMWPQLHSRRIVGLTTLGRLDEAESALDRAFALWPRHYSIWFARLYYFQNNGRAPEAVAMVEDVAKRPIGIPDWNFDLAAIQAKAMASRDPTAIRQALNAWDKAATRGTGLALNASLFAASVGDFDMAFRVLNALYFNRGFTLPDVQFSKEQGRYLRRRPTSNLFYPEFTRLRRDTRFSALTQELGLDEYWRRTGTRDRVVP